jgi:dsDNA-specific endonuclease/ATPase MutS2
LEDNKWGICTQTAINKISEIFQEDAVVRETRHQTLNTLQNQLQSVESEIRTEFAKNLSPKNINMFENSPIKPVNVNYLIQRKNKLQEKVGCVRIGKTLDTAKNASQLIKGPETILTISDNFTIFDRDA